MIIALDQHYFRLEGEVCLECSNMNGIMDEPMENSSPNSSGSPSNTNTTELKEKLNEKHHTNDSTSIDEKKLIDEHTNISNQPKSDENSCDGDQEQNDCSEDVPIKKPEIDLLTNGSTDSKFTSETEETLLTNGTNNNKKPLNTESKSVDPNIDESSKGSNKECSDEDSVKSVVSKEDDAVSINSDSIDFCSDTEKSFNQNKKPKNKIIILENDSQPETINGDCQSVGSPEIHEIISDNDDSDNGVSIVEEKSTDSDRRRQSARAKRRNYQEMECDSESDIEEIETEDPLNTNSNTIVIRNTKDLVNMTTKKAKSSHNNNKIEHTVVIIDSKAKNPTKKAKTTTANNSTNAQNIYQDIVSMKARGTTITPISTKADKLNIPIQNAPSSPTAQQPAILPSLTDDMFVVEAPSFIVPYVYEKPSMKPFKEFVTKLGQELEQQQIKEKEERDRIRKEKKEKGEPVSDSDEEKKKKSDKKKRRRKQNADDDDSWDGESSEESDDEMMSEEEPSPLKDKSDSLEIISETPGDKNVKTDSYFNSTLGKFFIDIGTNLIQGYVQNDLLKQQSRKLSREKKSGRSTKATESSISSLMKNLEFSKENNAPYLFSQKKCTLCTFKTESSLIMENHLETPHMRNGLYKCNFCTFEIKSPQDILYHMELQHKKKGKLERAPSCHQCSNCAFEDNSKAKLTRHVLSCAKKFKPDSNLAPPIEWEPPAKIPKIVKSRNFTSNSAFNMMNRQVPNILSKQLPMTTSTGVGTSAKGRGRSPRPMPNMGILPGMVIRGGATVRPSALATNLSLLKNGKQTSTNQPSISITPLPRQPQPVMTPQAKTSFVICEICDGYIKDLEQLRNHMQWIHRVKIHPKMIYNRPPLNCQKCLFRFFTDQGLERHLLGSHGLVTSSMQESANKGKDAGRCPVCGRVYQWKLLSHVAKDHGMILKPAHLSYKCTVCTATFGMYKQFESHVYSAHGVQGVQNALNKKGIDKDKKTPTPSTAKSDDPPLKPIKINDDITITSQAAGASTKKK